MGVKEQSDLDVGVIREMSNNFRASHKLVLTHPSRLEFLWFEIKENKEKVAEEQGALWERYNPRLKEKIDSFSDYIGEVYF